MNFKAVLALPKTADPAKTHKSISFIGIIWSTLYVYLWLPVKRDLVIVSKPFIYRWETQVVDIESLWTEGYAGHIPNSGHELAAYVLWLLSGLY